MEDDAFIGVVDVYDIATGIGKEFEKIIDSFGPDAITSLMPRVISALEHLEKFAIKHENSRDEIQELQTTICQLENEKVIKNQSRQRYEKDLEEIEDKLREESQELVAMVARLQDENQKLSTSLAQSEGMVVQSNGFHSEVDSKVLTKLKEVVEGQREQIQRQDAEILEKQSVIDNLTSQAESAHQVNKELRRRQRLTAGQMRTLVDERADLQAAFQEEQRLTAHLRQRLGVAEKENQDLSLSSNDSLDLSNKVVFDRDDPSRPRFTIMELKDILHQRNELKARVSDLEDEIKLYKPGSSRQRSHIICPPIDDDTEERDALSLNSSLPDSLSDQLQINSSPAAEDLPVHGPLPYEPEDAPWRKKSNSGIRKFFKFMSHLSEGLVEVKDGALPP